MRNEQNLNRYLATYAEPEVVEFLPERVSAEYRTAVVIPCYDEPAASVLALLRSVFDQGSDILVVLVINAPVDADKVPLQQTRQLLTDLLASYARQTPVGKQIAWLRDADGRLPDCMLVDCCSKRDYLIAKKQGVGRARKIGVDLVCALYKQLRVLTPLVFNTDADVHLPAGYIDAGLKACDDTTSAVVFPFRHVPQNEALGQVSQLYDFKLRYYVAGLVYARSPYAFSTIGSTLAIHLAHYVSVRGFPKRAGGEDFYLLNKLAKVGKVVSLASPEITLTGRLSHRVPFGTGPALKALVSNSADLCSFPIFYHPRCFDVLRCFQAALLQAIQNGGNRAGLSFEETLEQCGPKLTTDERYMLHTYAETADLEQKLRVIKHQYASAQSAQKSVLDWFDGFKTLKMIHFLRDHGYPNLSLSELAEHVTFLSAEDQHRLNKLRSFYE